MQPQYQVLQLLSESQYIYSSGGIDKFLCKYWTQYYNINRKQNRRCGLYDITIISMVIPMRRNLANNNYLGEKWSQPISVGVLFQKGHSLKIGIDSWRLFLEIITINDFHPGWISNYRQILLWCALKYIIQNFNVNLLHLLKIRFIYCSNHHRKHFYAVFFYSGSNADEIRWSCSSQINANLIFGVYSTISNSICSIT